MAVKYLKKAIKNASTDDAKTRITVQNILNDIEKTREKGINFFASAGCIEAHGASAGPVYRDFVTKKVLHCIQQVVEQHVRLLEGQTRFVGHVN